MHELYDGPLKRFLQKHMNGVDANNINPKGINVGEEFKNSLELGSLQEEIELTDIKGTDEKAEEVFIGLMDRLYESVGLKRHGRDGLGACLYTQNGSGKGLGILVTHTFFTESNYMLATVLNHSF